MGRGLASSGNFSIVTSFPLSRVPAKTSSLGDLKVAGRVPTGAAWLDSSVLGGMSTWELGGLAIRRAKG